ncbi:transporter [Olivibacter sp. CPCC 100613]|uniref:transporter n=1 Tax=Olivibacter sp. CPCC 100613 TaxID=3079931 RepID=UPI002FFCE1A9
MRKTLLLVAFIIFGYGSAIACDICGCGVGNYYLGILPDFNKRFIGLRYQYNTLQTHLGPGGLRTPLTADETYQIAEIWGAYNFGKKLRIMAFVPFNFNQRQVRAMDEYGEKNGLGDIAVMAYYRIFEGVVTTTNSKLFNHSLWAGVGIKAPTGKYDNSERENVSSDAPNNFQLGTGSTDFTFNLSYDARLMDLGFNLNLLYKLNTTNRYDYRYGNKFTGNALVYYKFLIHQKVRIAPNVGIRYEKAAQDVSYNRFYVSQSGGNLTSAIVGAEMNIGRLSLGANLQIPMTQMLADKRVHAGNRLMTHISYAF